MPRYRQEYMENNGKLVQEFASVENDKNCTPAQIALALVLAQGEGIIPIPGTQKRGCLEENAGAVDVTLSDGDLAALEELAKRYPNTGAR